MSKKDFIGIALDNDDLKVADVQIHKRKLRLRKIVRTTLSDEKKEKKEGAKKAEKKEEVVADSDVLFGIEGSSGEVKNKTGGDASQIFDDLDILSMTENVNGVHETEEEEGNENALFHILAGINAKQVRLGLNISSGSALFQILKENQFSELKPKQVREIVEEKLRSIYEQEKSPDQYAYDIREDGSLLLISIENNPALLELVDRGQLFYPGKVFVDKVLPDEAAVLGLTRANYELPDNEVTGIVLFGVKSTRLIFLKGKQITAVSPIISEGVRSNGILKTVFSKILLQLDSGVLPSLDRIIIANNMLGSETIEFLSKNFPDIPVEEFRFHANKFEVSDELEEDIAPYTTAIATAWAASGMDATVFAPFDFVPGYVKERQKVFKLEWHGVLLLVLIALTPIVFNYFYQIKQGQIRQIQEEIHRTDDFINQIHTTVVGTEYLSGKYQIMQKKLDLLKKVSNDSYRWSSILGVLNKGTDGVHGIWITSMRTVQNGIAIDGFSLYRNQIPRFASTFDDVLLQNVAIQDIRDHNFNKFSMVVKKVVADSTIYSPH